MTIISIPLDKRRYIQIHPRTPRRAGARATARIRFTRFAFGHNTYHCLAERLCMDQVFKLEAWTWTLSTLCRRYDTNPDVLSLPPPLSIVSPLPPLVRLLAPAEHTCATPGSHHVSIMLAMLRRYCATNDLGVRKGGPTIHGLLS
jgi:hypothetical protein